jgi:RNA polymerase sigma-70 factor (ECF subfamily)
LQKKTLFNNNTISKLSDEELLSFHKESGKNIYIGELFNRYLPLLYGVCLKYLKNNDSAQDAVMQLFENLLFKIADYEIDEFRTWVYIAAKNHCLQILRKEEQYITIDLLDNVVEFDEIPSILEEDDRSEQRKMLMDCLNELPEKQRVSITYFFINELSYAEIVDKAGYTLKHVKSYIQNGKRNLKNCLEKKGQ